MQYSDMLKPCTTWCVKRLISDGKISINELRRILSLWNKMAMEIGDRADEEILKKLDQSAMEELIQCVRECTVPIRYIGLSLIQTINCDILKDPNCIR